MLIIPFAVMTVLAARAEEQPSPILSNVSSTTISGYVDASAHWNVRLSSMRFDDLRQTLRQRGLHVKRFGNHYFFLRSGKVVLHLRKRGPFPTRSDILHVRRLLGGS